VWALGQTSGGEDKESTILVLRNNDGNWHQVPVPSEFARLEASAFSVVAADDVWVSADCVGGIECRPQFLHWTGTWQRVEIAPLPGGRTAGYSISNVHFVSPEEGWAIANDYDGPGLTRGLILRYHDGQWRNRNWNYRFWDAPWLGLFGH
jgi:hypothetical protein